MEYPSSKKQTASHAETQRRREFSPPEPAAEAALLCRFRPIAMMAEIRKEFEFPAVPAWVGESSFWYWWTHTSDLGRHHFIGLVWTISSLCFCFAAVALNRRRKAEWPLRTVYFLFVLMSSCLGASVADTGVLWARSGYLLPLLMALVACCEFLAWKRYQRRPLPPPVRPPIPRVARTAGAAGVGGGFQTSARDLDSSP